MHQNVMHKNCMFENRTRGGGSCQNEDKAAAAEFLRRLLTFHFRSQLFP